MATFSSQASPAVIAIIWALEIIGTAANSKVSRVLPRQEVGFDEMALDAAAIALGEFVFRDGGEETARPGWRA